VITEGKLRLHLILNIYIHQLVKPCEGKMIKADISLTGGTPPQSCRTSLAIGDHTVTCHPTSERAPPNPSHAGCYSINLPRRDGRL